MRPTAWAGRAARWRLSLIHIFFKVKKAAETDAGQNGSYDQQGKRRGAAAELFNNAGDHCGQLDLKHHQRQADKHGDHAGIGQHFFRNLTPGAARCKIGQPRRPHHKTLRNQINTGIQNALCAPQPFAHRIADKPGVGTDRRILKNLTLLRFHPVVQRARQYDAENLNQKRRDQKRCQFPENRRVDRNAKRMDRIAGQNHVDQQIRQAFLARIRHDFQFYQRRPQHQQNHHHAQYIAQIAQYHLLFLPRVFYKFCRSLSMVLKSCAFVKRVP